MSESPERVRLGVEPVDDADHALVFAEGAQVVKFHAVRTEATLLRRRLDAIREPGLGHLWLQPAGDAAWDAASGRMATRWPRVEVLDPRGPVPWAEAGRLLAELHRVPVEEPAPMVGPSAGVQASPSTAGPGSPPAHPSALLHGGLARLERTVMRLRDSGPSSAWLAELGERLIAEFPRPAASSWVHGDFHLGQLGRPTGGGWVFLDPDDLGVGDPAWDLGRVAGFWAAGLLDDRSWADFLDGYRVAGGPAIPPDGDPWPRLDFPARVAVLVATGRAGRTSHRDLTAKALLSACRRMAESPA